MNIGIDIDDTIAKTSEETDIWAKEYTEKILKREFKLNKKEILDPMWARYLYNWTEEEDKKFWDLYYEKIMENVKPKENAIDVINRLSKNNKIFIITARWDKDNGKILHITKQWLKQNNINYNQLFLGYLDKRNIIKENDIELFIDDSIKTCKEITEMKIRTLIMNSRINKNIEEEKIERVFSWKDIECKIQEVS